MTASRKKSAQGLQLDEIYLDGAQDRAGFWSDDASAARPLSARQDLRDFDAVQSHPANDHGRRSRPQLPEAPGVAGSRAFWWALAASLAIAALFPLLMGFGNAAARAALFASPAQYAPFWASLAALVALPWVFAVSASRQAATDEQLRRLMLATQRFHDPSAAAADAGRRINTSFDHLFTDIDARMALLDERSALFAHQISASMQQSAEAAQISITTMRSIAEASEAQHEALQRSSMSVSTELLPVIAKLETSIGSLDAVSQNAGTLLETIGSRLQQTTQDLMTCLDAFGRANHNVAPELERRMQRFEASIAQLPEQLDATIGRLGPMSDTIADAAILSTANIEVIDQLAKDITAVLDRSRATFAQLSTTSTEMFQAAAESHAWRFRDMLGAIVTEESGRVSNLSHEIGQLAEKALAAVDRLQQPVGEVTAATERALTNVNDSLDGLDQRIAANLTACVAELNDTAARLVSTVNREIETSALGLQTRLAASATELMQRVHADTARFENVIGETAERSASRLAGAIKDLPSVLAQRMDTEIAKIDNSLKGSLFGVSDQMRQIIDAVPSRLTAVTRETLQALDSNIERSFEDIALRSEQLNDHFRKTATETTDAVLQDYVDFIFLAAERFRGELEQVGHSFTRDVEARLNVLEHGDRVSLAAPGESVAQQAEDDPAATPDDTHGN